MKLDDQSVLLGLIYGALLQLEGQSCGDGLAFFSLATGMIVRSPVSDQYYRVRLEAIPRDVIGIELGGMLDPEAN